MSESYELKAEDVTEIAQRKPFPQSPGIFYCLVGQSGIKCMCVGESGK